MTAGWETAHERDDRRVLLGAVAAAALVHVAAIWIPLPKSPPAAAEAPPREAPLLQRWRPKPPPPPEPPRERPRPPAPPRRTIAVPEIRDLLEPAVEETPPMIEDAPDVDLPEVPYGRPQAPPLPAADREPRVVREDHPGLERPESISRADPAYPRMATIARAEAVVRLEALVDAEGRVVDVRVIDVDGGPDLGFSAAAIEAVSAWRYRPGRIDGEPVAVRLSVTIAFRLR